MMALWDGIKNLDFKNVFKIHLIKITSCVNQNMIKLSLFNKNDDKMTFKLIEMTYKSDKNDV